MGDYPPQGFLDPRTALKATVAALTGGYVLFPDVNGFIIQDSNLFWNNTTKRLGIGTAIPGANLDVSGTGNFTGVLTQNGANLAGTAYQSQSFQNLLKNGDFESWSAGAAAAPDGWTAFTLAVAKESTAANTKYGTYSMLLTSTGGANDRITNTVLSGTAYTNSIGKVFTYGVWVKSAVVVRVNILEDGLARSETNSNGSGVWQFVTVTRTVAGGGTGISVELFMPASASTAYIDGAILVEGSVCPVFAARPLYDDGITLQVDSVNNRVGIGTASPNYKIQVHSSDSHSIIQLTNVLTGSGASDGAYVGFVSGETSFRINNLEADSLRFMTNGSEKVTILSGGNVGIGTTAPATPLHVAIGGGAPAIVGAGDTVAVFQNSGAVGNLARFDIISGNAGASILQLGDNDDDDIGAIIYEQTTNKMAFRTNNVSDRLVIDSAGAITLAGAAFLTGLGAAAAGTTLVLAAGNEVRPLLSSEKFKDNIKDIEASSDIFNLVPRQFNWKESGEFDYGLIAEEAASVCPEIVNLDTDRKPISIKWATLTTLLLDKVKKQETRINDLEARLLALESKAG